MENFLLLLLINQTFHNKSKIKCIGKQPCHRCSEKKYLCEFKPQSPRGPKKKIFSLDFMGVEETQTLTLAPIKDEVTDVNSVGDTLPSLSELFPNTRTINQEIP